MSESIIDKIDSLLAQTKRVIASKKQTKLPFVRNKKRFNFKSWRYQKGQSKYLINLGQQTLKLLTKLLQILLIVKQNLRCKQTITKRNLFYQLVTYYEQYSSLDNDIEVICDSLSEVQICGKRSIVKRTDLNILASARSMVLGNIQMRINQSQKMIGTTKSILTLPMSKSLEVTNRKFNKILIIEKQSILFDFTQLKSSNKPCQSYNQSFFDDFLIVTSKGYPDNRIKQLLDILEPQVQEIYYLGDYDIYGFDILLTYAFGDWQYAGIFTKVKWLSLRCLIQKGYCDESVIQKSSLKLTTQDFQKASKIRQKDYMNVQKIYQAYQNIDQRHFFIEKMQRWRLCLEQMIKSGKKIQIQGVKSSVKDDNWIMRMITQKIYL